ncbi:MAG: response regulator transcription factor [Anaerolineae bacterium]|nr:response regulator transcription factor [Anaerolineae bacterium]
MTGQKRIRILIVDDHDMLREGLSAFLKAFHDLELVGEASSGIEAIRLCRELSPDIVLMDLVMPEMDGVAAIEEIHSQQPEIRIIALSSFGEDKLIKGAMRAGATSYLLKNISADKLAEAIRATHSGLPTLAPEVARNLLAVGERDPDGLNDALTAREHDVLNLLIEGLSNAEIGQRLSISIFTVKNHVSSILSKLGVNSRTEAVSLVLQQGIVLKN